jgi:beta-ribofuranosylaminobenzene 5'-phosphate synthase
MHATSVKVDAECIRDSDKFLAVPDSATARGAARLELWTSLTPVQRAVLGSDGSFTLLLTALLGQEVKVALIEQSVDRMPRYGEAIQLQKGARVLNRNVRLYVEPERNVVFASSVIAIDRIAAPLANDLLAGKETIGRILRKHRLETFRELVDWGTAPTPDDAIGHFPATEMMYRSYRIISAGKPVMIVTEFFDRRTF